MAEKTASMMGSRRADSMAVLLVVATVVRMAVLLVVPALMAL
jgi:hypothetical protein